MQAFFVPPAHGQGWSDSLQFHGFASQGFIDTTDNNFFGKSENGSFDFTELGINASIRPVPDLLFSAQILSRRAGKGDRGNIRLDYGLVDFSILSNGMGSLGIRIGKIKNPFGFYNETRDVAFTRPSIFLPQSIYFVRTRNPALSSDSLIAYGERQMASGNLFFQVGLGYPNVDGIETERAVLLSDRLGRLDDQLSYIGSILFEQNEGEVRLGLSSAVVNINYKPGTGDPLRAGSIRFRPLIFSAQYHAESWSITSEYALRFFKKKDLVAIPDSEQTGKSFYLQGTYRILKRLEGVIRYDLLYQDRDDKNGNKFTSQTGLPNHLVFAKDWTFGLRWDITNSLMSRIEYHHVDGTAWLPLLDNPDPSSIKQDWNMFAFLLSYRF
ncbi:MAG: hypothetical protein ACE5GK_01280 [Nitrospiria bacterium]